LITLLGPVLNTARSSLARLQKFHDAVRTIVDAIDDGQFGETFSIVAVVEFACLNGSQIRAHVHLAYIPLTKGVVPQASAIVRYWRDAHDGELPNSKAITFGGTLSRRLRYLAKGPRGTSTSEQHWDLAGKHLLDPFEYKTGQRAALYLRSSEVSPWQMQCLRAHVRVRSTRSGTPKRRFQRLSADEQAAKQVPDHLQLPGSHAPRCSHCKSTNSKRNGKTRAGIQRHLCRTCKRTFTDRPVMAGREEATLRRQLASRVRRLRDLHNWTWRDILESLGVGFRTAKRLYEWHRSRYA
tara:strand:- start:43232 stop:44119 length:888 start_codon:yes stop_codon:yes gene_type:complete